MIIASDIKISSSWGLSLRGDRFHNLGVTKCKSEVWSTQSLTHTRTSTQQSIAQSDGKHTTKVCHRIFFLRFYPIHQLLLQSVCRFWLLTSWLIWRRGEECWEIVVNISLVWLLFRLTGGWSRGRAGHHFPKIIFLVFINCGTGVKLNKNSEIQIHSNIEMWSENGHFWSR